MANDGFYNGSFTDMFTYEGHTFLPTEHGFARLFLTLSGKSSNIAKLTFTIHKASNVFVAFVNSTNEYTVMVRIFFWKHLELQKPKPTLKH